MRVGKTNAERARLFFCVVIFFLFCCCYYFVKRSFFSEEEDATLRCAADDDGTKYRCKHKKRSLSTTHTTVHWRMTKVLAASCCGGLAPTKLEKHKQSSSKSFVRKRAQAKERESRVRERESECANVRSLRQVSCLSLSWERERASLELLLLLLLLLLLIYCLTITVYYIVRWTCWQLVRNRYRYIIDRSRIVKQINRNELTHIWVLYVVEFKWSPRKCDNS